MAMKYTILKKYRVENDVTLAEIAKKLSVNKSTVLRWERGDVAIPPQRLRTLERLTGISRHDLRPDLYPKDEAAA